MDIRGKGVKFDTVKAAIEGVSEEYGGNLRVHSDAKPLGVDGYGFRGRVDVSDSRGPGARVSWSGRHGPWACWHAYRDALRAVFEVYPHATVKTSLATYKGSDGFESTYPATANKNIGSMAAPAYMPDLCDCH